MRNSSGTLVGNALVMKARVVKDLGNRVVHDTRQVPPGGAAVALRELFHFGYWLVRTYAKGAKPQPGLQFAADALPKTQQVEAKTLAGLQAIAADYEKKTKAHEEAEAARVQTQEQRDALDEEIKRLRAEIAAPSRPSGTPRTTTTTTRPRPATCSSTGCRGRPAGRCRRAAIGSMRSTGMPNAQARASSITCSGGPTGSRSPSSRSSARRGPPPGQQQAELYADALEAPFGHRPVIFYTNGYEHWLWDDAWTRQARRVALNRDELELAIQRRSTRRRLATEPVNTDVAGRAYQQRAIKAADEAFERECLRRALLVMATGRARPAPSLR